MSQGPYELSESLNRLLAFRQEREWRQFHRPKELAAAIAIEAAELQELFLWRDPETTEQLLCSDPARLVRVREEVADITSYLLLLAHDLAIDLAAVVADKLDKNEQRYPVARHKGVATKAGHSQEALKD